MSTNRSPKQPAGRTRPAQQSAARQRAGAVREAQRARVRRRRLLRTVVAPVLVVLLLVVGLVVVKTVVGKTTAATAPAARPAAAVSGTTLAKALQQIPASVFDAVGVGTGIHPPATVTGAPLTAAGKPRVLYVGAEYCPYCAGERWAVVAAMSRFGSFDHLGTTASSSSDVDPNTASLSFHGATYTSSLLSFTGVEEFTNTAGPAGDYPKLDSLTTADRQIATVYNPQSSIPFVDFGNRFVITGASYDVSVLQGLGHGDIAARMADPGTQVSQQVLGAANMMTAVLCRMTGGRPAAVCSSKSVTSVQLG